MVAIKGHHPSVTPLARMISYAFLGLVLLIGTVRSFPKTDAGLTEWDGLATTYAGEDISNNVDFYLYTQATKENPIKSRVGDLKLFGGKIDISKPTKILIHGYMSHKDRGFSKTMRGGYLDKAAVNVVNVDWSKDAFAMYNTARDDVPAVGKVVAKFIDRLVKEMGLRPENLHVIGHSLGAHIAGVAGLNVKTGLLRRITGLDPAGPLFSYEDKERLMPSSAAFVDVIHTCGKALGFFERLGHVDFYPNQGISSQPGCSISFGKCSHQRAVLFFVESIANPNAFLGRQCDSWDAYIQGKCDKNPSAFMGENVSRNARGQYWLWTGKVAPFGLGPNAGSKKRS